jgi:hypothetical protein
MNSWPTFSSRVIFWTSAASVGVGVGVTDAGVDAAGDDGPVSERAPVSWQADVAIAPAARAVTSFQPNVRRTRTTVVTPRVESKPALLISPYSLWCRP